MLFIQCKWKYKGGCIYCNLLLLLLLLLISSYYYYYYYHRVIIISLSKCVLKHLFKTLLTHEKKPKISPNQLRSLLNQFPSFPSPPIVPLHLCRHSPTTPTIASLSPRLLCPLPLLSTGAPFQTPALRGLPVVTTPQPRLPGLSTFSTR